MLYRHRHIISDVSDKNGKYYGCMRTVYYMFVIHAYIHTYITYTRVIMIDETLHVLVGNSS